MIMGKKLEKVFIIFLFIFFLFSTVGAYLTSDGNYAFIYLYFGFPYIFSSLIISICYVFKSLSTKKIIAFSFYIIPVLLSVVLCFYISEYKQKIWEKEMLEIVTKVEKYFSSNGTQVIDKNELLELNITEDITISIYSDNYFIKNEKKKVGYSSRSKETYTFD
jgi:hypothetical protein